MATAQGPSWCRGGSNRQPGLLPVIEGLACGSRPELLSSMLGWAFITNIVFIIFCISPWELGLNHPFLGEYSPSCGRGSTVLTAPLGCEQGLPSLPITCQEQAALCLPQSGGRLLVPSLSFQREGTPWVAAPHVRKVFDSLRNRRKKNVLFLAIGMIFPFPECVL
jgi:hypothetical protein